MKVKFYVFDTTKMDENTRKAKEQWGHTSEYKEYAKSNQITPIVTLQNISFVCKRLQQPAERY